MTTSVVIAPIVEGHGEVKAVRELISRIASNYFESWPVIAQPFRLDSAKMRKPEELARAIRFQSARVEGRGGVLVLRDGDDSDITCPIELAAAMKPDSAIVTVPVEIVIARQEYEAWFLAAAESLRVHSAVRDDAVAPKDPEAKRGAKSQLEAMMVESYKETLHQAKFSAIIDLHSACERSRSFRRMVHAVELLVS
ncbi:DUF4276 family protein [Nocardia sp. XZ_19_369]|uniref:DUF4276 family protein n=1 Tax=Nocardia sp. XZ_19_369 TaxID=2769487 RepID=UPI00188E1035|nr:DUF4276 family protein [Nocardia sp. XZ_19_369]